MIHGPDMLAFDDMRIEIHYDFRYTILELVQIKLKLLLGKIAECPSMSIVAGMGVRDDEGEGIELNITTLKRKFPDLIHIRITIILVLIHRLEMAVGEEYLYLVTSPH